MADFPQRRMLPHIPPPWVKDSARYFVTICTQPRHRNQLCLPEVAEKLLASAAHYHDTQRWWLTLLLLMPDHLHALTAVGKGSSLPDVVRLWKGYQTKTLGIAWQTGFFDHRLRSSESEEEKTNYIRLNPVRAGLIEKAEAWPYYWPKS